MCRGNNLPLIPESTEPIEGYVPPVYLSSEERLGVYVSRPAIAAALRYPSLRVPSQTCHGSQVSGLSGKEKPRKRP